VTASVIDSWRGIALDAVASGATRYYYPFDMEADNASNGVSVPFAGTIKNFRFSVSAVPTGAGDSTVSILKNGSSDELSVSFSTTGQKTNTGSFSVSAGDTILPKAVAGGTAGNLELAWYTFELVPNDSGKTYTFLGANSAGSSLRSANGTVYMPPVGDRDYDSTEANAQYKSPIAGTVRYFQAISGTMQAGSGTSTLTLRINGATPSGAPTLSFGESDDGTLKVDSTNTASLAVDDLIAVEWAISGSSGGNANFEKIGMWIESTNNEFIMVSADIVGGQRMPVDATYYYGPGAIMLDEGATQVQAEVVHTLAFTAKRLHVMSDGEVGTVGTHSVTVLDDGGSATALTVSFADGETGWKHDNSNTVAFDADDALSFEIAMAAGGTNRDWNVIGIVCQVATERRWIFGA
jgi:hypothetical protein